MEDVVAQLMDLLIPLLTTAITILVGFLGKLIAGKIQESKTKLDDQLAGIAVRWVKDFAKSTAGLDKFNLAVDRLIDMAKKRGSKLDRDDAERLIRSAYTGIIVPLEKIESGK